MRNSPQSHIEADGFDSNTKAPRQLLGIKKYKLVDISFDGGNGTTDHPYIKEICISLSAEKRLISSVICKVSSSFGKCQLFANASAVCQLQWYFFFIMLLSCVYIWPIAYINFAL